MEKVGKFKDFTDKGGEKEMTTETKKYANKVLFARLSKEGNHVYMFNHDGILSPEFESLLMNVSDLEKLIAGKYESIKVSAMPKKEED